MASQSTRTYIFRPRSYEEIKGDLTKYQALVCDFDGEARISATCLLPSNVDFSRCDKVFLCYCDLKHVRNYKFMEGSVVDLADAKLADELKLSQCKKVNLSGCFAVLLYNHNITLKK